MQTARQSSARRLVGILAALLTAAPGCVSLGGDERPTYAADDPRTRPWATCVTAGADDMDDGSADPWTVGQAVAEECAPRLLEAFAKTPSTADRQRTYALTAEKATALVLANRRDAPPEAPGYPETTYPEM